MLFGVRQANAKDTRSVVWNHVETYTVNMTPRTKTIDHFRNRNLKLIISFYWIHNHILFNNAITCKPHLGKLVKLACPTKAAYGPRSEADCQSLAAMDIVVIVTAIAVVYSSSTTIMGG